MNKPLCRVPVCITQDSVCVRQLINKQNSHSFRLPTKPIEDTQIVITRQTTLHKQMTKLPKERPQPIMIPFIQRRSSQFEYVSMKQRRLNDVAPSTVIQQVQHMVHLGKRRKFSKIRMHCKILSKSKRVTKKGQSNSVVVLKSRINRIQRMKSAGTATVVSNITPLDDALNNKIDQLGRMSSIKFIRRTTTMQSDMRSTIVVSKERLLRYRDAMQLRMANSISSSSESSPIMQRQPKLIKSQFSRKLIQPTKNIKQSAHLNLLQHQKTKSINHYFTNSTRSVKIKPVHFPSLSLVDFMHQQATPAPPPERLKTQECAATQRRQLLLKKLKPYLNSGY